MAAVDSPPRAAERQPRMLPQRTMVSLRTKLVIAYIGSLTLVAGAAAWMSSHSNSSLLVFGAGVAVGLVIGLPLMWRLSTRLRRVLGAMIDGLHSFIERDYSLRLAVPGNDEPARLATLFNEMGETLRTEQNTLYQNQLLLESVVSRSPVGILMADASGRIVLANLAARQLLGSGKPLEGRSLHDTVGALAPEMAAAVERGRDELLTLDLGGGTETYHVARQRFTLDSLPHDLVIIGPMTWVMARQEVKIWKKVIRIIAHELKNSLAPISSLTHSARLILNNPRHMHRLEGIFDTIEERTTHLRTFIDGYARYARLAEPEPADVDWENFIGHLAELIPFRVVGNLPATTGWFDRGQLEQVMINLIKNAREAGGDEEEVCLTVVQSADRACCIMVHDRGSGMSDEVMAQALLPFYSTKQEGSGLGLPLCREIVEAHGGELVIERRDEGGTTVKCYLPAPNE